MVTLANWALNELLLIDGERYLVHSRTADKAVNLQHQLDNRFITLNETELRKKWSDGNLTRLPATQRDCPNSQVGHLPRPPLSEKQRQEAERRFPYLRTYASLRFKRTTRYFLEPLIAQVAAEENDDNPPSVPLLRNWIGKWEKQGCPDLVDVWRIAPSYHQRGKKKTEFDPDVEIILDETIKALWLTPTKSFGRDVLRKTIERIGALDPEGRDPRYLDASGELRAPSLATIYRRIKLEAIDKVVAGQRGREEAERLCMPVVRGPRAMYPLHMVEIDHTVLDCIVLDSDHNVPLGRPTITAALDRYSRMIVGFHISFAPPSAHTVMLCLRNAILPKDYLQDMFPDTEMYWPCHGVGHTYVVDNGMEFHSNSTLEAILVLGSNIQYCPAGKPWFKGMIERWFGTLSPMLKKIPGTTFSNTKEKGRYKSEKAAILTLNDLHYLLTHWIVTDYSIDVHSELGCSPLEEWDRGVQVHPVAMPPHVEDLNIALTRVQMRKLTRSGVQCFGLIYNSNSRVFRNLINRPDKPEKVKIRIDDDDISRVYVEDWVTGDFISVPSIDPEYTANLSLPAHKIFAEISRGQVKERERISTPLLMRSRAYAEKFIIGLKKNGKLRDKRLAHALGGQNVRNKLPVRANENAEEVLNVLNRYGTGIDDQAPAPDLINKTEYDDDDYLYESFKEKISYSSNLEDSGG